MTGQSQDLIAHNEQAHDRVASSYEKLHTEIYNSIEQERLRNALETARGYVASSETAHAFDFGCGAGNLTKHLLDMGVEVTAGDVSQGFLDLVQEKYGASGMQLETIKLTGKDLSHIPSDSFDMVATYSVLHHIPDYVSAVRELIRVTKPGGIIFLDHEKNDRYWNSDSVLIEYYRKNRFRTFLHKLPRLLKLDFYITKLKRIRNPRYQSEGDIHVYPDDHIEWDAIMSLFKEMQVEVVHEEDYLLYNGMHRKDLYECFKEKTSDTKLLIGRKTSV